RQVRDFCDLAIPRWVFRATVHRKLGSKGFVGYGDADPSNVSPLVRGAEMRVAETRAVNRALRKAYGIGLCSVEELGWLTGSSSPAADREQSVRPPHQNGSSNPNCGTGCAFSSASTTSIRHWLRRMRLTSAARQ